jgi:Raf kinase inhibitor-like YbhB/YbcL family protein
MTFRLWSDEFVDGGPLALAHAHGGTGHGGGNRSPHLAWRGAPPRTRCFTLAMFDPDPASDSGWWHWVVINIPLSATSLPRGAGAGVPLPPGALQTRTDFGRPGYGGPAPEPGRTNRYHFTLHALPAPLELDEDASGAMVSWLTNTHSLAKAQLVLYSQPAS